MNCQQIAQALQAMEQFLQGLLQEDERRQARAVVVALQRQCNELGCNPNLFRR